MTSESVTFRSDFHRLGFMPLFPETAIRDEPALRGCPVQWARSYGGPIVRAFIAALPPEWIADPETRIRSMPVWLRQGWSAGHVGWHLDGIRMRADGEEDWLGGRPAEYRRIGCNMGSNSATRVLVGDIRLTRYPLGQPLVSLSLRSLDDQLAAGTAREVAVQEGELFVLSANSLHSVSAASRDGWRMFLDANRPSLEGQPLPPVEALYNETYTDFQPTNAREQVLMAAYAPSDPR